MFKFFTRFISEFDYGAVCIAIRIGAIICSSDRFGVLALLAGKDRHRVFSFFIAVQDDTGSEFISSSGDLQEQEKAQVDQRAEQSGNEQDGGDEYTAKPG